MAEDEGNNRVQEPTPDPSPKVGKEVHLERIYYGNSTGALRGPKALYEQAQREGLKEITRKDCEEYLKSQSVYTRFRPARRRYPRNRIISYFCGETVQIDLMDMQQCRAENDGYLYAFLSYDTYSKYLTSFPIRNKKPESAILGLEDLVARAPYTVSRIYWDREGAFWSNTVQKWLKAHDIINYSTTSSVKAPGVERAIRTIRNALSRYFLATGTLRWIDYLPKFISAYNNRVHSTTKHRPLDLVIDPMISYKHKKDPPKRVELPSIGAMVRLNENRGPFGKESKGTWTKEVFRVTKHQTNTPIPMIYIEDLKGEPIEGGFYPEEYQEIDWDGHKEPQVLGQRQRNGVIEYLVAYDGWPPKFNKWLPYDPTL